MNQEQFTLEEVIIAFEYCRKHKKNSSGYLDFYKDLNRNLFILYKKLNKQTYTVGRSITFVVNKRREVFAADFRDRVVQHILVNRIIKYFEREVIYDSYSCRTGKGTLFGVNRCYEQILECSRNYTIPTYILKCDIKSFFMSINKKKFEKIFLKFINKYETDNFKKQGILYLFMLILWDQPQKHCIRKMSLSKWDNIPPEKSLFYSDEIHGIPIGNITSQIFANLFLNPLDRFIKEVLGFEFYGRYVDDFFIISTDKNKLLAAIPKIKAFLESMNLKLHPKKIYLQKVEKGVQFLGINIKKGFRLVLSRTKGRIWDILKRYNEYYYQEGCYLEPNEIDYIFRSVNSYLGFLRQTDSYRLRKKILTGTFINPFIGIYFCVDKDYKKLKLLKYIKKEIRYYGYNRQLCENT